MKKLIAIALFMVFVTVKADVITPRSGVSNWVNVRKEGVSGPVVEIVGHLHPGENAKFVSEASGYFKIELDDGTLGFVSKAWTNRVSEAAPNIKIATFNIQIFGETKAAKPEVMQELAAIIRKYDVIAIQEIKNVTGVVPTQFLTQINSDGSQYSFVISERGGKEPDDQSSQEQYAYYLNTSSIRVLSDAGLFDDSTNDQFQREPYVVRFGVNDGDFTFALITVHTKPENAVNEIKALHDVFGWAKEQFPDEDDFIALGDFNAGCDYAAQSDFANTPIADQYTWLVPDNADTNVSTTTACAYDRIVVTTDVLEDYTGNWGVDTSVTDKKVSDHFPVWAEFHR